MSRKVVLGPVNRVEGDLEVRLDLEDGIVREARIVANLYRGFENLLIGKPPLDALVITPRVCGICSVSQSVASAKALADFGGIQPAQNGQLVTNLILGCEVVTDLLTHFYLFFMPDFCDESYSDRHWYRHAATQFTAVKGRRHGEFLKARAEFLHLMGLLAGKWPHSLVIQPGGVTKQVSQSEQLKVLGIIGGLRRFVEQTLFGDSLDDILSLSSDAQLRQWAQRQDLHASDLAAFLAISEDLELVDLGRSYDHLLSMPMFGVDNHALTPGGVTVAGERSALTLDRISEDLAAAWLAGERQHPAEGYTRPDAHKADAYTWCKAPRYDEMPMETGALARQWHQGNALAVDLVNGNGANVHSRIVARLVEVAQLLQQLDQWARAIVPADTFCTRTTLPDSGQGVGLTEAARGALGHWITVDQGKISNYQLVAPTSWNFSPRDGAGTPGPLENALVGIHHDSPRGRQLLQHIIRSFDPCMVCTVH